jgi:hypothetical protein
MMLHRAPPRGRPTPGAVRKRRCRAKQRAGLSVEPVDICAEIIGLLIRLRRVRSAEVYERGEIGRAIRALLLDAARG